MENKGLEQLMEACGKELCPDCECCEMVWEDCENCGGEGYFSEYDDELMDDADYPCDVCGGEGAHKVCLGHCDENGVHAHEKKKDAGGVILNSKTPDELTTKR